MKIIDLKHQTRQFFIPEGYENIYNNFFNNTTKFAVLKPLFLKINELESWPIRVVFFRAKNFEILMELHIKRQVQLLELFKILNKLNIPKNAIGTILNLILTNWNEDYKNKDLTLIKNNNTHDYLLNAIYNEELVENYGEYSKTSI